ncbi:MAG: hypothetical protein JWM16_3826 [Verrucomicrobiales bacterium]|nr:hypothetical protein [Verrucomicrobiales bacterium]
MVRIQTNLLASVSKEKFALDFQAFALQWQSKMENSMRTIVASQEESLGGTIQIEKAGHRMANLWYYEKLKFLASTGSKPNGAS